ncbi:hypothetical protein ACH5RR_040563 [Cinchona calisaya]|uniref:DUF7746 domain-containing protein n=1 Tax=Cinchona calisaya TaxID=153742 RepID=A0ABD2XTT9_9GENT
MQFEERHTISLSQYNGKGLCEWNLDGQTYHQMYNTIQEMGMCATAYKAKGNTDHQSANLLIAKFTSKKDGGMTIQLKMKKNYTNCNKKGYSDSNRINRK